MAFLAFAACGDDDDITGFGNAPADHTISKSGAMHKAGLEDATVKCLDATVPT